MPDIVSLPPSSLLVDQENPRLLRPNEGQREALRALAEEMPRKIVNLAKDIVEQGLNPSDLLIVMPADEDRYVVLEGNRRVVALKALENPDTFMGALDIGALKIIRELSKVYQKDPVDEVSCVRVKSRDEASHWIELRHTGENNGAGIVPWGGDETARFRARAKSGKNALSLQLLGFLERAGKLEDSERKAVAVTTLDRILSSPAIREKLCLALSDGELILSAPKSQHSKAMKSIMSVIDKLVAGKLPVQDVYTKEKRDKFADSLPDITWKEGAKLEEISLLDPADGQSSSQPPKPKSGPRTAKPRDRLIPKDCVLKISHKRIKAIEQELRQLSLESHANAVAVLMRVFIELSADVYLLKNPISGVDEMSKMGVKMENIAKDLTSRNKLTSQQAKPIFKGARKGLYMGASVDLMHDYVHNQEAFPAPVDLRAHWDSFQPFLTAIWSP